MAKRPTSRSQADDASGAVPASGRRGKRTRAGGAGTAPSTSPASTTETTAQAAGAGTVASANGSGVSGNGSADPSQDFDATRPEAVTSESVSMSSEPSEEDIRLRAYHRYLERGGSHGADFEDWLEAERELRNR